MDTSSLSILSIYASKCLSVTAGKIPALEDVVHLRFKEHMVITVEPSHDRTVSPFRLSF